MKHFAIICVGILAAAATCSDAFALSLGTPECRETGASWSDMVNLSCGSPAVPDNSVHYCIVQLKSDNTQIVLITSGDTFTVQEGTPNGSFSVNFRAVAAGTANISARQTNTTPPFDAPTSLGQINVVAPGLCPPPPGPPPPPPGQPPRITGSADPASLDIFPEDTLPPSVPPTTAVTTTWTVPAGFGDTTILGSSQSSLVEIQFSPQVIGAGHTSSVIFGFFVPSDRSVPSPVSTHLQFTARSANHPDIILIVPIRIEANRPPPVMQTGGDVRNGVIDFGTVWPGDAASRSLSLINQGPALSRFRGDIYGDPSALSFPIVSALAFNAQGGRANDTKCSPNLYISVDLFAGERCEFTFQFQPTTVGRNTANLTFGGGWGPQPSGGVPISLVGETPEFISVPLLRGALIPIIPQMP